MDREGGGGGGGEVNESMVCEEQNNGEGEVRGRIGAMW